MNASTLHFLTKTVLRAVTTLIIAVSFTFVMLRISGDPVTAALGIDIPPEVADLFRKQWGLDRPLNEQFMIYLSNLLHGNFGYSFRTQQSALHLVMQKVPATLALMGSALSISLVIGVSLGVVAARGRGRWPDRLVMSSAVLVHSLPTFLTAIIAIQLFAVVLHLTPSGGGGNFSHLVLPAAVIGLYNAGAIARFTRSSVLEVLNQPYILAARARRVSSWRLIFLHLLPNAALPLLTLLGFLVGGMIGGSMVIETVFAWPGVGNFMVTAVETRDLAVVQTIILLVTFCVIISNLTVDLLYLAFDPRMRNSRIN